MKEHVAETWGARHQRIAELYVRCAPETVRLAYLMTGDAELAKDLAQEAFVRAVGRFADIRDPTAFPRYLRRTVVNLSRSYFRRRRVERTYVTGETVRSRDQRTHLPDIETRDELLAALRKLPDRQRAVVVLRYCEGLSEQETAELLKCSVKAVKSLGGRGLSRLRQLVGGIRDG